MVGKDSYRRTLISGQSARLICGYIYASAGEGESTQDLYGHQARVEFAGFLRPQIKFDSADDLGRAETQRRGDEAPHRLRRIGPIDLIGSIDANH